MASSGVPISNDENSDKNEKNPSGFDNKFVNPLLLRDSDECAICTFIVKSPVLIAKEGCGHIFCRECVMKWISVSENSDVLNPRCPYDNIEIKREDIVPSLAQERNILSMLVYCKNEELGCQFTPQLRDYHTHIKDCQYNVKSCPLLCGENMPSWLLDIHKSQDCTKRVVNCGHCQEKVKFDELEKHIEVCPLYKVTCPYCNTEEMFRKELDWHLNEECTKYPTHCGFALFGCNEKIPRQQLTGHHEASLQDHASLLNEAMQQIYVAVGVSWPHAEAPKISEKKATSSLELPLHMREVLDSRDGNLPWKNIGDKKRENVSLRDDIDRLEVEQRQCSSKLKEAEQKYKDFESRITKKLDDMKKDKKALEKKIEQTYLRLNRFIQKDVLTEMSDDNTLYLCPLEWHVDLVQGMKERTPGIGCYSKPGGYVLTLMVKSDGAWFEINCRIQRGNNDADLSWPYAGGEMLEIREKYSKKVLGTDSTPKKDGSCRPNGLFGKPLFSVRVKPESLPNKVVATIKKRDS